MADVNKSIQEFERGRIQLSAIENQRQSMEIQSKALEEAITELKASKEQKVYKAAGNILILSDAKRVEKELKEQKETMDLRVKTLKKQEEAMLDKLNKLKADIEGFQKPAESNSSEKEE